MIREKNKAKIIGKISEPFVFSHHTHDADIYRTVLDIKRESDYIDKIPIEMVATPHFIETFQVGTQVSIDGEVRTYNSEGHLKVVLFVNLIKKVENEQDMNVVEMTGYICKPTIYRKTPLGRRICDFLVAIPRTTKKSSYVPCLVWGRNADFAQHLNIGEKVLLQGRIQSREYVKKISDEELVTKIAREVSCSVIKVL